MYVIREGTSVTEMKGISPQGELMLGMSVAQSMLKHLEVPGEAPHHSSLVVVFVVLSELLSSL